MQATSGWLVSGVALVGLTIGYMSGGSQTPVVSAAIPVIFGLVATAFAVLQTKSGKISNTSSRPTSPLHPHLALRRDEKRQLTLIASAHLQRNIGICLVTFSIGFLVGAHCGAYVRLHDVLRPQAAPADFAWKSLEPPPSVEAALQWLAIQQRMETAGYSANQIGEIYQIQIKEWRTRATIGNRVMEIAKTTPKADNNAPPSDNSPTSSAILLDIFNRCQEVKGVISPECNKSIDEGLLKFMSRKGEGGGVFSATTRSE